MNYNINKINKLLGMNVREFRFACCNIEIIGWRSVQFIDYHPLERRKFETEWLAHNAPRLWQQGLRCFLGPSDLVRWTCPDHILKNSMSLVVYVLPISVPDIVEFARTGTIGFLHGVKNRTKDDWRVVKDIITRISKKAVFDITYADEAGIHATLLRQVTLPVAQEIEDSILEVAIDTMESSGAIPDENGEGSVTAYILKYNKFVLWWDE